MGDLHMTGAEAHFLFDVFEAALPKGVPMVYDPTKGAVAKSLERKGLIERHYLSEKQGALLTDKGRKTITAIVAQHAAKQV